MSKYNRHSQKTNSSMKSEDRENVFHQANSIISHSNQKDVKNGMKIEESKKPNGSISSSKDIMDKLRQKYPSKTSEYIENNAVCSIKDNNDDDDLLLYCEGDEAEKNKDRLLSFDAKKYELVTTDEKLDDGEEFEFNGAETYESSPSDKFSPTGKPIPGFNRNAHFLKPDSGSPQLSFKAGSSTRSLSPASFMQTMTPPNTMIDSCLSGREEPIKQTLLKALNGLKD